MYAYEHAFDDRETQDWLDNQLRRYENDGFGLWAAVAKETGDFVGQVGLTKQETPRGTETEIGWLLKKRIGARALQPKPRKAAGSMLLTY